MEDLVFIKLGGSLITDKQRDAHPRLAVIKDLATQIRRALDRLQREGKSWRLLLGHGSGSFGHAAAVRHGFLDERSPIAAAQVARAASRLNGLVTDALLDAGVPAWPWSPSSVVSARGGKLRGGGLGSLTDALDRGLVPVVYGDVVLDSEQGAMIASTEAVVSYLEPRLGRRGYPIRQLLWLGETDGIWDAAGTVVPRIDGANYRRVRRAVGGSAGTDVTGGMLLRLDTAWQLARRGVGSLIVDGRRPGLLESALCDPPPRPPTSALGEDAVASAVPGTVVVPLGSSPAD